MIRAHRARKGSPGPVVVWLIVCCSVMGAARGEGIAWQKDFASALESAQARGVPLVLEFHSKTCPHCQRMERTVHADPAVERLSAGQAWVRLDQQNDEEARRLVRELNAGATPTYMAVAHDGKTVYWRFSGAVGAAGFVHNVSLIDTSADDKLAPAKRALTRGELDEGKALLRQVIDSGASDTTDDALVLLGCAENAAWTEDGARAARELWTRALSQHPTSDRAPDAAFYLSALLADVGEREAAAKLEALLKEYPKVDVAAAKRIVAPDAPNVAVATPLEPPAKPPLPPSTREQIEAVAESSVIDDDVAATAPQVAQRTEPPAVERTEAAPNPPPEAAAKVEPAAPALAPAAPAPAPAPVGKGPVTLAEMRKQQPKGIAA